jgi:hypothetical protein
MECSMLDRWTVKLQVSDLQATGPSLPGQLQPRAPHVYPVSMAHHRRYIRHKAIYRFGGPRFLRGLTFVHSVPKNRHPSQTSFPWLNRHFTRRLRQISQAFWFRLCLTRCMAAATPRVGTQEGTQDGCGEDWRREYEWICSAYISLLETALTPD